MNEAIGDTAKFFRFDGEINGDGGMTTGRANAGEEHQQELADCREKPGDGGRVGPRRAAWAAALSSEVKSLFGREQGPPR
jgi:hypothetical protein